MSNDTVVQFRKPGEVVDVHHRHRSRETNGWVSRTTMLTRIYKLGPRTIGNDCAGLITWRK